MSSSATRIASAWKLRDKTRAPGKKPVAIETVNKVLALTCGDPPGEMTCNSSNLIRQSLLVSETEPGAGRGSHPRWDRDPPSGETEISE